MSIPLKKIDEVLSKLLIPQMLKDVKAREEFHKRLMKRIERPGRVRLNRSRAR